MQRFFVRQEERSFTQAVARGRFLWLLVAALALPLAASLAENSAKSERFDAFQDSSLR